MSTVAIQDTLREFKRYDGYVRKVLEQVDSDALNRIPVDGGNSIGMILNHLHGNLRSRFTDFLTTDGEKPWRDREAEFARIHVTPAEAMTLWRDGWAVLETTLNGLSDADMDLTVMIRGQALSVREALLRALAHVSYHVGQMVLLARTVRAEDWTWITIPPGGTQAYNQNPTKEKGS